MRVELLDAFIDQLNDQVDFIARDKPTAARKFKNDILKEVKQIGQRPFSFRHSDYFEEENYRDMVFKGYKVVFKIDEEKDTVFVLGLVNMQKGL